MNARSIAGLFVSLSIVLATACEENSIATGGAATGTEERVGSTRSAVEAAPSGSLSSSTCEVERSGAPGPPAWDYTITCYYDCLTADAQSFYPTNVTTGTQPAGCPPTHACPEALTTTEIGNSVLYGGPCSGGPPPAGTGTGSGT